MQLSMFLKDIMTSLTHIINDDDHQNDDERNFLKTSQNTVRDIAEKRTNALVKEAQKLIQDIQNGEKSAAAGKRSRNAHSLEVLLVLKPRQPQMPLQKRKKQEIL